METKYLIQRMATQYDSFYLYDEQSIISRINLLKKFFPSVEFLYSIRCNPNENILKSIFKNNFGASVSSIGEFRLAQKLGLPKEKIFYSAPGKSMNDLQDSYEHLMLIADSISEIERLKYLAKVRNEQIKIGIRINPNFTYEKDEGISSKFGIDEKDAIDYLEKNDELYVKIVGIHTHIKSQELDCSKLNRYHKKVFQLAEKIEYSIGHKLDFINLGSGIGIPYSQDDKEFNIEWLGSEMEERISNFKMSHPKIKVFMESGRYIVGKCGTYVTHVIDKKKSRGKTFVILQNMLNGFFGPSMSHLIKNYSGKENPESLEPLFTKLNANEIKILNPTNETELVTVVGNLCTEADVILSDCILPRLRIGDVVTFSNAGSYAFVLSPMQFGLQEKPAELFFTVDGEMNY